MIVPARHEGSHRIVSTLPPDELWELVRQGFEDSEQSELWPRELERVSSEGLHQGGSVTARYAVLGPFGATQTYRISRFDPPRAMAYETGPGHPLRGGGEVEVRPRAGGGSELSWTLGYDIPRKAASYFGYVYVTRYFEPRFFAAFEANLRAAEARRHRSSSSTVSERERMAAS